MTIADVVLPIGGAVLIGFVAVFVCGTVVNLRDRKHEKELMKRMETLGGSLGVGLSHTDLAAFQKQFGSYALSYFTIGGTSMPPAPTAYGTPSPVEESDEIISGWRTFTPSDVASQYTITIQPYPGTLQTYPSIAPTPAPTPAGRRDGGLIGSHGKTWHTGTLDAACEHGSTIAECLALPDAPCGIYSYRDQPAVHSDRVLARVTNAGIVHQYTQGYRAQQCRIEHLWLVVGELRPGDTGMTATRAEAYAVEWERKYDCPVELTTAQHLDEMKQKENELQWAQSAHLSKSLASLYLREPLSQSVLNELTSLTENL